MSFESESDNFSSYRGKGQRKSWRPLEDLGQLLLLLPMGKVSWISEIGRVVFSENQKLYVPQLRPCWVEVELPHD